LAVATAGEFTLGIEEEFQIIDPETGELRCVVSELIESNTPLDEVHLQRELHQSMVEVATGICANVAEARRDVCRNRAALARVAERVGMRIGAASTHPFARWQEQTISHTARYVELVGEMQDIARANLIFGMHVHVGIPDREEAIAVFNSARYFLPHFLALSTSSPFFNGRRTGLQSTRSLIFQRLPRTGIPERFGSYGAFERFLATLVKTGCIDDGRRIWWDIRPHPTFSTLEFRVCDLPTRIDHVISIAALIQAVVAKLTKLHRQNLSFNVHRTALIQENKWRAARYGVGGELLDLGLAAAKPFAGLARELLAFVDDVLDELGSRAECHGILDIVEHGTSADRQLAIYEESGGNFKAVVDDIVEQTTAGIGTD
jgi:carboxylate-amine ligase